MKRLACAILVCFALVLTAACSDDTEPVKDTGTDVTVVDAGQDSSLGETAPSEASVPPSEASVPDSSPAVEASVVDAATSD